MSSPQAKANQGLYLARILLRSWLQSIDAEELPASILNQAFAPAVRNHLVDAYGWFLMEVSGLESATGERPPRHCGELPQVPEGKVVAGEIREFQQLENEGWLADLLRQPQFTDASSGHGENLARPVEQGTDIEQAQQWLTRLEAVFERMRDSLDEY